MNMLPGCFFACFEYEKYYYENAGSIWKFASRPGLALVAVNWAVIYVSEDTWLSLFQYRRRNRQVSGCLCAIRPGRRKTARRAER